MTDMTDWDDDILSEDETDDGIIELTDIVVEGSDTTTDETIIELTDIVEHESAELELDEDQQDPSELELDIAESDDTGFELDIDTEDAELELDMAEKDTELDLDIETDVPVAVETVEKADPVSELNVSPELLEAALERVIERKFADKIETILFEVTEKIIEKEIVDIKESLQKDLDQIGNT